MNRSQYPTQIVLEDGQRIQLKQKIGQGSYGEVYLTNDQHVVKIMNKVQIRAKQAQQIVSREIKILEKLKRKNENVTGFIMHTTTDKSYVLKFKFANKGDLKNFIVNNIDSLLSDPSLPIKIFLDCLMNLTTIRKENIIHRDLKPENVLIHEEKNGQLRVIITDFGCGHIGQEARTMIVGTHIYMAPEVYQISEEGYDENCDIWSLGMMTPQLYMGINKNKPYYSGEYVKKITILENAFWENMPYHDKSSRETSIREFYNNIIHTESPMLPKIMPKFLRRLTFQMLDPNPKTRISFVGIYKHLICSLEEMRPYLNDKWDEYRVQIVEKHGIQVNLLKKKEQTINLFKVMKEIMEKILKPTLRGGFNQNLNPVVLEFLYQIIERISQKRDCILRGGTEREQFYDYIDRNDFLKIRDLMERIKQLLLIRKIDIQEERKKPTHCQRIRKFGKHSENYVEALNPGHAGEIMHWVKKLFQS